MNRTGFYRNFYVEGLKQWLGAPVIKVLVGMRRVGKSTILRQWAEFLCQQNFCSPSQMLFVECDSLEYMDLQTASQLKDLIMPLEKKNGQKVLLIDEVQMIKDWEKVINALHKKGDWEIYLTGSNSELLSGELASLLSGRYIQFEIFPFSYQEHLNIKGLQEHSTDTFNRYLALGGMPTLYHLPEEEQLARETLESIYSTIVLKDVVERYQLRNIALLENLVKYFFDNIGNLTTAKRIADYCKSQRLSVGVETVQNYVHYLESCFIVHKLKRHDLKGKRLLEVNEKLFINDLGLRNAVLSRRTEDVGALLENLVFLELRRRGYALTVGFWGESEVDFVAEKKGQREYFQVCYQMSDTDTTEREFRVLEQLPDNYPKTVLSMDEIDLGRNGIQHRYLPQWLLEA